MLIAQILFSDVCVKILSLRNGVLRFTPHLTRRQTNCCRKPNFSMWFLAYPTHEVTPNIIRPICKT